MFQDSPPHPIQCPRSAPALRLLLGSTVDPPFDPSKHHFQKNGLRTHPTAPDAAKRCRKDGNANHTREKQQQQEPQVLRPEGHAEEHKSPVNQIHQHELMTTNMEKRRCHKEHDQDRCYDGPPAIVCSIRLPCIDPLAPAVLGNTCHFRSEPFVIFDIDVNDGHGNSIACVKWTAEQLTRWLRCRIRTWNFPTFFDRFGFGWIGATLGDDIGHNLENIFIR